MARIHKSEVNLVFNYIFTWDIEKKSSVAVISFIFLRPGRQIHGYSEWPFIQIALMATIPFSNFKVFFPGYIVAYKSSFTKLKKKKKQKTQPKPKTFRYHGVWRLDSPKSC